MLATGRSRVNETESPVRLFGAYCGSAPARVSSVVAEESVTLTLRGQQGRGSNEREESAR